MQENSNVKDRIIRYAMKNMHWDKSIVRPVHGVVTRLHHQPAYTGVDMDYISECMGHSSSAMQSPNIH
jgi:hypothetical protein